MSQLHGRLGRLERRRSTLLVPQSREGHPTVEEYFNGLTTREEREEFLVLVQDVHAVQQREHAAHEAGAAIPPRSGDEQARIDALNRRFNKASS